MQFSYRAVLANGTIGSGELDAPDHPAALVALRRMGARPIEVETARAPSAARRASAPASAARRTAMALTGDLAALLGAGLPLDRALALAISNVEDKASAALLADMLANVREGMPLSAAMARQPAIFAPVSSAMAEAGEANGHQAEAIGRLAKLLENAEQLRSTVRTAMIYPIMLTAVAVGVILMMLLFVVPQFESLFAQAKGDLPAASAFVMGASRFVRQWGWVLLAALVATGFIVRQMLSTERAKRSFDAFVLRIPHLGRLVRFIETARFARTLGSLLEGDVPLLKALLLARRTVDNIAMGTKIDDVADGLRQGGGLAAPLTACGALPPIANAFLRTGEEASQLGPMLLRLADVLDREVQTLLQRLIGFLTPAITIFLGTAVASIIAAIMSAIIGFNDLAISS